MHVRSFQLSDHRSVTDLLEDVLSEACYEETMAAFARQLSWDPELVLVAMSEKRIIGVIIGTIDHNNGYYYRIAVHQDYRHRGIGKSLITAMKQLFKHRKVSRIMVTVDAHNERVLPLYESLGYQATDFFRSFQRLSISNDSM